ncbi:MAG: VanZ family protein [Gemmatimonadales bacterium]
MNFTWPERHRRLIRAAYLAAVVVLTLAPIPEGVASRFPWWFDKAMHTGLFACLAALLSWRPTGFPPLPPPVVPAARQVLGPVIALAGLIELAQSLLPYRTGDVWDFVWGVVGGVAGYLAVATLGVTSVQD